MKLVQPQIPVPHWKGPRAPKTIRDFRPEMGQPGSVLQWEERGEFRTGQVWSKADLDSTVWVIPFDRRDGEQAVKLVCRPRKGIVRYLETQTR